MGKNKQDTIDDDFFAKCLKLASGPNGLIGNVWGADEIEGLQRLAGDPAKEALGPLDLIAEHRTKSIPG